MNFNAEMPPSCNQFISLLATGRRESFYIFLKVSQIKFTEFIFNNCLWLGSKPSEMANGPLAS